MKQIEEHEITLQQRFFWHSGKHSLEMEIKRRYYVFFTMMKMYNKMSINLRKIK
jgi:hypothetical protein